MNTSVRVLRMVVLLVAACGCSESKEDFIAQGRAAILQQDLERAMKSFDKALSIDADDFNALWGRQQVYGLQHDYSKQEEGLRVLLDAPKHKQRGATVKEELEKVYRKLADVAEKETDTEKYLAQAIEVVPRSEANNVLAQLYMNRAKKASSQGKFTDAATAYRAIDKLRVSRKVKRDAEGKAEIAGFMGFKADFATEFGKTQKELVEAGQYDAKNGRFTIEGIVDPEGDPKAEEFEKEAMLSANANARTVLEDLTFKLAGLTRPEGATLEFGAGLVTVEEKGWVKKNKQYRVKVSLPEDAIFHHVYLLKHPELAAKEAPKKDVAGTEKPEEPKPAEEGEADAGEKGEP